jgi:predicted nucleic acid-binding protein
VNGTDVAYYLDTSAAAKLVQREPESTALLSWAAEHADDVVSSDLLRTELLRATRRGAPELMSRARAVVDSITLLVLPPMTFERAAELDPPQMRSLDAIHLAAARELGDELDALVTYDEGLAAAAELHGITVIAPA